MRVLLDTDALLWFITDGPRLGRRAKAVIERPGAEVLVSVASLGEVAIKHALGKLPLSQPFADLFPAPLKRDGIAVLPIEMHHLYVARRAAPPPSGPVRPAARRPALTEGRPVLARDPQLGADPVDVVWS